MEFTYKAYVPSLDKFVSVKQLKTREYIELVKFVANDDKIAISEAFDSLIATLVTDINCDRLTRLDKFFILITIRSICVGSVLSITFNDNNNSTPYTSRVNLFEMLQKIADIEYKFKKKVKINKNVSISLKIPRDIYITTEEEIILGCIDKIHIEKTAHDVSGMSLSEKRKVVESLPGLVLNDIYSYINTGIAKFSDVELFRKMNPAAPVDSEVYTVNLFDASLFTFATMCYNEGLTYIRDVIYVLHKRCNFSTDLIMDSTFAEVRMYVDLYEEEVREQEKEYQKQKQASSSPPSIGSSPHSSL